MRRHSPGEAVDDLGELLDALLISKNAQRRDDNGLRPPPIYSDSFLLYIATHPDGVSMQNILERFQLPHSSASRTCASLAGHGLVHVSRHPEDGRQSFVKLTARGQRVIDDVLTAFRGKRR
jgi:DNA-binding transcriptional ArsR family regulator